MKGNNLLESICKELCSPTDTKTDISVLVSAKNINNEPYHHLKIFLFIADPSITSILQSCFLTNGNCVDLTDP